MNDQEIKDYEDRDQRKKRDPWAWLFGGLSVGRLNKEIEK